MRIFSGIQPTGAKHFGNYSGGFRQYAATQEQGEAFFCIVDLHSITVDYDPADLRERTLDLAALLFATGLDPDRSTVFAQSHVTAHAEAAWLLSAVTSYGQLGRMTQFKEKGDRQEFVTAGLFTYPILMAGDILLYQTDIVPIGDDQRQHLELARDVAERFNTRFGQTFTVPDGVYPEIGARIMDLQEPTKKMSTTGGTPQGTVLLLDPPDVVRKKIKSAVTDSGSEVRRGDDKAGVTNLIDIMTVATGETRRGDRGPLRRTAGTGSSRPTSPTRWSSCSSRSRAATPSCAATPASSRGCSRSAPTRRGRRRRRPCARCTSGWASSRLASRTPTPVFTTRPELRGTFGAVASTHWLASSTGMSVLERGGNAFDAAVAAGFVLQVVEPHLNGPGGDLPVVLWPAARGEPLVLCAQGVSPAAATIERFRGLGHELVPGTGPLAACVPGAFGGWLLLLLEFGTWRLEDVLAYAIGYAEDGYPVVPGIVAAIEAAEPLLEDWPASAELYLPPPQAGSLFRNRALAATWRRLLDESGGGSREHELERARRVFYEGFVAEEIDRASRAGGGLLTGDDLAAWRATLEPPATVDYRGLTVCKTGAWGQGPAGLQQLRAARGLRRRGAR